MNKLIVALFAGAFAFGTTAVLADDSDMKPLTKAETDAAKNERAAAKAKWAAMTPEQQAEMKKVAKAKKQSDLSMLELYAQESGNSSATSPERAEAKKNIDASKAQPKPTKAERQQYGTTMEKKASSGQ